MVVAARQDDLAAASAVGMRIALRRTERGRNRGQTTDLKLEGLSNRLVGSFLELADSRVRLRWLS